MTTHESDIAQEILAAFYSLVDASKTLDTTAYFSHFDEDRFVGLNSDGTNWNSFEDLRVLIEHGFAAIECIDELVFTNVNVSVLDTRTAVLVNEYVQSMTLKSGASIQIAGGGTQVWAKHSGPWKLVSVSASNKPNAE
ncbi:MAG: nuclear transport factor 2 family protein [Bacteroidota bacterium]